MYNNSTPRTVCLCPISPCPGSLHMLQVLSRCTPGTHTPNPICHPHTSCMCGFTEPCVCSGFRSGHHPCGHSVACPLESVCVCTFVCVCWFCVFHRTHLRYVAPGRALSRLQESLWERVWETFREIVRKAVRWICVHHGYIWPRGGDRRCEQRVSTKEQQRQCRQSPTNPLLKWSSDRGVRRLRVGNCVAF